MESIYNKYCIRCIHFNPSAWFIRGVLTPDCYKGYNLDEEKLSYGQCLDFKENKVNINKNRIEKDIK